MLKLSLKHSRVLRSQFKLLVSCSSLHIISTKLQRLVLEVNGIKPQLDWDVHQQVN